MKPLRSDKTRELLCNLYNQLRLNISNCMDTSLISVYAEISDKFESAFVELALMERETKEFARRETGVKVNIKEFKNLESYWCSHCDTRVNRYTIDKNCININTTYCSNCGTKLIFPEIVSIDDEPNF